MAWDRSTNEQWVIELRRRMGADVATGVIAGPVANAQELNLRSRIDPERSGFPPHRPVLARQ